MEIIPVIRHALNEDIGHGDVTTLCTIDEETWLNGRLIAKADGVIAGCEVFSRTLKMLDERVDVDWLISDGDTVVPGTLLAEVNGPGQPLLTGERAALNFLQRMSGIATTTSNFREALKETKAIILDTRKTAPGLRILDKWAVKIGGGQNHRFGLFDMALIKDNHIAAAGSITKAVKMVREQDRERRPIEVEVKNKDELMEALALDVNRILLDNMTPEQLREAVKLTSGRVALEASGNVTLENIRQIAETGVDYISSGALTHSVKALDISFLIEENRIDL
jgi:nicotinate-nucleotide pyrophosphorylase (carboxylating)